MDGRSLATTLSFDPATERWSKAGRLGTPRAASAASILPDGRVLVAGGHLALNEDGPGGSTEPTVMLTAYHPTPPIPTSRPPLSDIIPQTTVKALATAELFDPASGSWSPTGPMRYPRSGAVAATLASGRVLVVGSAVDAAFPLWPDERALTTAEIYDPVTGRFTSAGTFPSIPKHHGIASDRLRSQPVRIGALVTLPDGGAALIGQISFAYNTNGMTRSFRFDLDSSSWSELGVPWIRVSNDTADPIRLAEGPDIGGAAVVALADGNALVTGAGRPKNDMDSPLLATARIYDPATDRLGERDRTCRRRGRWRRPCGSPTARSSCSVATRRRYWWGSAPLRTAFRFVPER